MKFKDMLLPISLALLTTWGIQYWFFGDKRSVSQGSPTEFVAPKSKIEMRPLNKEIDFIDQNRISPEILTEVDTDLAKYTFSSDGASLERLEYKGNTVKQLAGLGSIFPVADTERENKFLLLAFDEKTPYYYSFISRKDNPESIELAYKYESNDSDFIVKKTFIVYKNQYKLDLRVEVEPKDGIQKNVETRLFFSSPLMVSLGKEDVISSVLFDNKDKFKKTALGLLNDAIGNYNPKLFGTDSKYFVHSMVGDKDGYAQRAYYKIVDGTKLVSILEGPSSSQVQSYRIEFYFGPKEEGALAAVDVRLEKTLDYSGLFSIISKFLLMVLKFLNNYLKNYGLAILVLTLIIRLLLMPFSIQADSGMKKRTEFQKKLDYIQKKYAQDKETLARERAELIKKHGMPGLSGCLPLLLQIPVFIALSNLLRSSIEMYHA
ncbi:MAG: 60 kDa inner membrane insertion protein, partial [uncultured bacterium]